MDSTPAISSKSQSKPNMLQLSRFEVAQACCKSTSRRMKNQETACCFCGKFRLSVGISKLQLTFQYPFSYSSRSISVVCVKKNQISQRIRFNFPPSFSLQLSRVPRFFNLSSHNQLFSFQSCIFLFRDDTSLSTFQNLKNKAYENNQLLCFL